MLATPGSTAAGGRRRSASGIRPPGGCAAPPSRCRAGVGVPASSESVPEFGRRVESVPESLVNCSAAARELCYSFRCKSFIPPHLVSGAPSRLSEPLTAAPIDRIDSARSVPACWCRTPVSSDARNRGARRTWRVRHEHARALVGRDDDRRRRRRHVSGPRAAGRRPHHPGLDLSPAERARRRARADARPRGSHRRRAARRCRSSTARSTGRR